MAKMINATMMKSKAIKPMVHLLCLERKDITHLIKLAKNNDLVNHLGWDPYFEEHEINRFIDAISEHTLHFSKKSKPIIFGIFPNSSKLPVGYTVIKGINEQLLSAEIGVAILDKNIKNKGYGPLSLRKLIDYAFQELNLKKLEATILASNKASINMVKKAGFVERKFMPKSWKMPNEELVDMIWFELIM